MWAQFAQAVAGDALKSGLQSAGGDAKSTTLDSGRQTTTLGPITAGGAITVGGAGVPMWALAAAAAAAALVALIWRRG